MARYDTQAMVAAMMGNNRRDDDDTGTLLALLQFVQGQDAMAASRSQFSERLGFERERANKADELLGKQFGLQESQVQAQIANAAAQTDMLRQQINDARLAGFADRRFRNEQAARGDRLQDRLTTIQEENAKLQRTMVEKQLESAQFMETLQAINAYVDPMHNQRTADIVAGAQAETERNARTEAQQKINAAASMAPAARSLDTVLGQLGEISTQGWGRDVRQAPELAKRVGDLVSKVGAEVFKTDSAGRVKVDPVAAETAKPVLEAARATLSAKTHQTGTSYGFGVSRIGRILTGAKDPAEQLKDTLVSQIDSMIYQLDKFGGAASGELRRLDQSSAVNQRAREAVGVENAAVQAVRQQAYGNRPGAREAIQAYRSAATQPAIRDPAGSGGEKDPTRAAVNQYIMQGW